MVKMGIEVEAEAIFKFEYHYLIIAKDRRSMLTINSC